jgi:retinol dehydrogenase-14
MAQRRRSWPARGAPLGPPSPGSSDGFVPRTVVVTGATSGIGEALARALVGRVETLAVVGRDLRKLDDLAASLTGGPGGTAVGTHLADLANLEQVRRLGAELTARYPRIEVLVNNAGAYFSRFEETVDHHERTFALNVLSPFLLTRLLRPSLGVAAPSRVVNVASAAHNGPKLDLEDLDSRRRYSGFRAYGRSKLALILLTHEFARRWAPDKVSVNALHPGFVRTRFGCNNPGPTAAVIRLLTRVFGISAVRGAETPLYLATSPQVGVASGEYFVRRRAVRSSRDSYDDGVARKLWDVCAAWTGLDA